VIPDSFKQDLLNRVDIVEVVQRYVRLKKAGANFVGLCPFHNEKTPSFSVSPAKQFYHCFGCGAHGNAIGFLMAYGGMGYVDAVKDLAAGAGMQMPEWQPRSREEEQRRERETDLYALLERAMDFYRAELKKSDRAIQYLKGRGLSGEIAARFRIGYAPDDWQALKTEFPEYDDKALVECGLVIENEGKRYDRFRDRVMFPIFSARGAVVGFGGRVLGEGEPKYLNSPETPLFEKGRELYGLVQARDAIRAANRVLVVEGYMDVVALAQCGVGYAVATLGTATTPVHVQKLLRLADELVFSFDGDAAGRKAAWRALEVSLPLAADAKPIRFLFLPEGEDPDTFVRKAGKDEFEKRVREAQTLSEFLIGQLRAETDLATPEGRSRLLSMARPHLQKVAAPALRIQLLKEIASLGRVTQEEAERLMQLPGPGARGPAPAPRRPTYEAPSTTEWKLLVSVLNDLELARQLDTGLLSPGLPESNALVAIAERCRASEPVPTFPMLLESLEGSPHIEVVLAAQRHAEDFRLGASEFSDALRKLEVARQGKELEAMRARMERGMATKEELLAYREKLTEYKRLQGALPGAG